ncbi:MAG: hypothetical protein JST00_22415 [Deltaproteobacteria bacterium]|nr:hypothetical protein [Deltaproteobacteria bacterium]
MSRPARLFVIFAAASCGAPRSSGIDVPTLPPVVSAPASPAPGPRPAPDVGESPPLSSSPPPRARVRAIELGMFNGCALYEDGRVACWDRPALHVAGEVKIVTELPKVDRLHVGFHFACARAESDHALWCWGENDSGQLGRGSKSKGREPPARVTTKGGDPIVATDFLVGSSHMCLLTPSGDVTCVGRNVAGQGGRRPSQDAAGRWVDVVAPNTVFRGAVRVYGGEETACAVDAQEKLHCWGGQDGGYNGHGDTFAPRAIPTPGKVRAMAFGSGHSCLLDLEGSVHCRGWNPGGQLGAAGRPQKALDGTGAFDDDFEPRFVRVTELDKRYVSIAASRHETCAVSTEGDLTCIGSPDWRSALSRRLSNSPPRSAGSCTFFVVPPPKTYVPPKGGRVASSSSSSTVLPTRFTQARCSSVPEAGLTDVTWVAATMGQRCTVHRDGAVRCVGDRIDGTGIDDDPVLLPIP